MLRSCLAAIMGLFLAMLSQAQPGTAEATIPNLGFAERYELGRRLRQFEETWNQVEDTTLRKKALEDLPKLTTQFFSFQFGEAGRTLDVAKSILKQPKTTEQSFIDSLYLVPESRLIDADQPTLKLTVKPFYVVPLDPPVSPAISFWWKNTRFANRMATMEKFPFRWEVPVTNPKEMPANWLEDYRPRVRIASAKQCYANTSFTITRVKDLKARLEALKQPADVPGIEAATLKERYDFLSEMANGFVPETDWPAGQLLLEAEAIRANGKQPYFTHTKDGQFWFSVPTAGKKRTACRIFVPKGLDKTKPVPIVVALHGAGGSENLFFEGYGAGQIVKECERRGWLLLTTRSGIGFSSAPPIPAILDQLKDRYPIDRQRVFLVGHSMGAAQAIAACQDYPGQFKAVAALGGGGSVRKQEALAKLPVYVGVGDKDFALFPARGLSKALASAGANVTFKEFPTLEHLLIVREALPEVFQQWDTLAR